MQPLAHDFRLPPKLVYLYVAGPVLTAPLLMPHVFESDLRTAVVHIGGSFVPFLSIPLAIHSFYAYVVPPLFRRFDLGRGPLLLHAVLTALVAVAVALVIRPLHAACYPEPPLLVPWLATCVVITWAFVLPALLVMQLRERAHEAERRLLSERQAALKAQLEALQARTNPHFLFNALNTIASLIPDEPELAEATVERLAGLLRYALQSARKGLVPLEQELSMIGDYLEVQKARFGSRLRFEVSVQGDTRNVLVPPLLLQPLVENAVLHGIAQLEEGGRVKLSVTRQGEALEIRVEDDGPGPGRSQHRGSGTSLSDLRTRIALVYGDGAELTTSRGEQGGFSARLRVPLEAPA